MFFKRKCGNCGTNNPRVAINCVSCGAPLVSGRATVFDRRQESSKSTEPVERDRSRAIACCEQGLTNFNQGQYDRAIADYSQAIELDPESAASAAAYNNRGIAYREKKQHDWAMRDYSRAIQLDPKYAQAYLNRAAIYEENGQRGLAIGDYNMVIKVATDPSFVQTAQRQLRKLEGK